jgi:carboxyl-terminal processing protease
VSEEENWFRFRHAPLIRLRAPNGWIEDAVDLSMGEQWAPPVQPGTAVAAAERRQRPGWLNTLLVIAACWVTGTAVTNFTSTSLGAVIYHLFPHFGPTLDDGSINYAWATVQRHYFQRSVDSSVGTQGAEAGMVAALKAKFQDRFTSYLTADEAKARSDELSGSRAGSIGISLEAHCANGQICSPSDPPGHLVILDVLRNQPAEKGGLLNGDEVLSVNGKPVSTFGKNNSELVSNTSKAIQGPAGTPVVLLVQRGAQQLALTVVRANLSIPSVYAVRFGKVLYIQITEFDESTGNDVRDRLNAAMAQDPPTSVILDLRENGGGLVSSAQRVVSQFVRHIPGRQDDVVVRRGRLGPDGNPASAQEITRDAIEDNGAALDTKVVVLIDGGTASASEITSSALRDYHRAQLVGTNSFGKGSVQVDFPLPDGSDLHLTVEKWYAPCGESIDLKGVAPDKAVARSSDAARYRLDAQGIGPEADPQLQAALALANAPGGPPGAAVKPC